MPRTATCLFFPYCRVDVLPSLFPPYNLQCSLPSFSSSGNHSAKLPTECWICIDHRPPYLPPMATFFLSHTTPQLQHLYVLTAWHHRHHPVSSLVYLRHLATIALGMCTTSTHQSFHPSMRIPELFLTQLLLLLHGLVLSTHCMSTSAVLHLGLLVFLLALLFVLSYARNLLSVHPSTVGLTVILYVLPSILASRLLLTQFLCVRMMLATGLQPYSLPLYVTMYCPGVLLRPLVVLRLFFPPFCSRVFCQAVFCIMHSSIHPMLVFKVHRIFHLLRAYFRFTWFYLLFRGTSKYFFTSCDDVVF
uniref:Uncharacterized protein n=1 Tax=Lygus hesperus TaxID=30085 RepID=A0A0A9X0I4_LYGHE